MMDQPAAGPDMKPHIVAFGCDPVDIARRNPHQPGSVRRPEFLEERRHVGAVARGILLVAMLEMEPGAIERGDQPRRLDRLH